MFHPDFGPFYVAFGHFLSEAIVSFNLSFQKCSPFFFNFFLLRFCVVVHFIFDNFMLFIFGYVSILIIIISWFFVRPVSVRFHPVTAHHSSTNPKTQQRSIHYHCDLSL